MITERRVKKTKIVAETKEVEYEIIEYVTSDGSIFRSIRNAESHERALLLREQVKALPHVEFLNHTWYLVRNKTHVNTLLDYTIGVDPKYGRYPIEDSMYPVEYPALMYVEVEEVNEIKFQYVYKEDTHRLESIFLENYC